MSLTPDQRGTTSFTTVTLLAIRLVSPRIKESGSKERMNLTVTTKVQQLFLFIFLKFSGLPATKCGPEKMDDHRMSAATRKPPFNWLQTILYLFSFRAELNVPPPLWKELKSKHPWLPEQLRDRRLLSPVDSLNKKNLLKSVFYSLIHSLNYLLTFSSRKSSGVVF